MLINREVLKSNVPINSAAADPVAELHFLLLSVNFIGEFLFWYTSDFTIRFYYYKNGR